MPLARFFKRSFQNRIGVNSWKRLWSLATSGSSLAPSKVWPSRPYDVLGNKTNRALRMIVHKVTNFFKDIGLVRFAPADIPELDEGNFLVYLKQHGRVFVMWYDPLCPVCRKATVYFERLHEEMGRSLAFGAIDGTGNPDLAMAQEIHAFPTFRLYSCNGGCRYKHHEGGLNLEEMKNFVRFAILGDDLVHDPWLYESKPPNGPRIFLHENSQYFYPLCGMALNQARHFLYCTSNKNILDSSENSISTLRRGISSTPCILTVQLIPRIIKVGNDLLTISKSVMEVTGKNFHEKINSFDSALVYFYATWCVHSGRSLKEYIKAADMIEDSVGSLAICNVEESLEIVDKYYVGKIPTVKYFRKGRYITDYVGEIKVNLLMKFMKEPHVDSEFIMKVTRHKPLGDLHKGDVLVPTQKRKMWQGKKNGSDLILEVTKDNIDKMLKENPSFMLLFYTCWSKICIGLNKDYVLVAKAVEKKDVVLGAVDCEEHVEVADRYLITKFPTIKYFRNGQVIRDFNGDYRAESILNFLKDPTKLQVAPKISAQTKRQDEDPVPPYWKGIPGGEVMLHFTDFNYKALIRSNPSIFLMFYVPWCKPCATMKREFAEAALTLDKKYGVLAACDAERNNEVADAFTVLKLPTLKYIKNCEIVTDYTGLRVAQEFVAFMENPPEKRVLVLPTLPDFKAGKS